MGEQFPPFCGQAHGSNDGTPIGGRVRVPEPAPIRWYAMLRRTSFTAIAVGISVVYKFMDHLRFTKPVVTWLDGKMGSGTLIEILFGLVILYLILDKKATSDRLVPQVSTLHQPTFFGRGSTMRSMIDAIRHPRQQPAQEGTAPESQPRPIPVRRRTLNIVAKKAGITWLNEAGNFFYEPEGKGKLKAIVAEFRNEPGEFAVTTWHHVRASIAYHNERGSEVAHVGRAAWLDEIGSVVDLPSHITRKLIVAIQTADGAWIALDGVGGSAKTLSTDIRRTKIILHDNKQFSVSYTLAVHLNQDKLESLVSFARRD